MYHHYQLVDRCMFTVHSRKGYEDHQARAKPAAMLHPHLDDWNSSPRLVVHRSAVRGKLESKLDDRKAKRLADGFSHGLSELHACNGIDERDLDNHDLFDEVMRSDVVRLEAQLLRSQSHRRERHALDALHKGRKKRRNDAGLSTTRTHVPSPGAAQLRGT